MNNSPLMYTDPSGHQAWDGCSGENGGCAGGNDYKDYVYNLWHTGQERQENQEDLEKAVDTVTTVIGVVNEPADWMMTAAYCAAGDCSPWVLVGLLPFVPGSAGRHADEAIALTGQFHHVISNKIMKGLDEHKILRGVFKRNDLIVQAFDLSSHSGYQTWHRNYDAAAVQWLIKNKAATAEEFLSYMLDVYKQTDMKNRFPDAYEWIEKGLEKIR